MRHTDFSSIARGGDILLFSGRDDRSRCVQRWLGSPWSQAALVITLPGFTEPLVLEATSVPSCPDIENGTLRTGVRTVRLSERLASFEGAVALRPLQPALDDAGRERLRIYRATVIGRPFEFSPAETRRLYRRGHTAWTGASYFCSALVAEALQTMGVLALPSDGPLPNNVLPSDFWTNDTLPWTGPSPADPVLLVSEAQAAARMRSMSRSVAVSSPIMPFMVTSRRTTVRAISSSTVSSAKV